MSHNRKTTRTHSLPGVYNYDTDELNENSSDFDDDLDKGKDSVNVVVVTKKKTRRRNPRISHRKSSKKQRTVSLDTLGDNLDTLDTIEAVSVDETLETIEALETIDTLPEEASSSPLNVEPTSVETSVNAFTESLRKILTCPITHKLLVGPVVASDGNTYSKAALQDWISVWYDNHPDSYPVSPVSGLPLTNLYIFDNEVVQKILDRTSLI